MRMSAKVSIFPLSCHVMCGCPRFIWCSMLELACKPNCFQQWLCATLSCHVSVMCVRHWMSDVAAIGSDVRPGMKCSMTSLCFISGVFLIHQLNMSRCNFHD